MDEIQRIEDRLRRAFEGHAWHGPAVRELVADVTAAKAAGRPRPGVHNIWEIVLHMTTGEGVVWRRLQGETVADLPAEQDWPPVQDTSEAAWRRAIQNLQQANRGVCDAIARTSEAHLAAVPPSTDHSVYAMLHGLIQHDLYHAGQIAALKQARS
jgi:uncharacterized damage-inducible protein DinB